MTPKQEAAIRKHGEQLLALFPDAAEQDPIKLCKRLRRLEGEAHRHAERICSDASYCNGGGIEGIPARIAQRVAKLLGSGRVWLNGDPRGYALKVDLRDGERLNTDWGGYGIIAPEIGPDGH